MADVGVQTSALLCSMCTLATLERAQVDGGDRESVGEAEADEHDDDDDEDDKDGEDDYAPSESLTESSGSDEEDDEEEGDDGRSYIVFWSCLATLFQLVRCAGCGMIANTVRRRVCSTMLRVIILCTVCRHETKWESQTREPGGAPAGNIMLSTAIMTAGALPSKVLRVLRYMSVAVHSTRTYFRHQRELVMPAVQRVWLEQQQWLLASLQAEDRPLVFCGDGRADSPGHSAKFGSYVMMELEANVIVDMQLVQVRLI